MAIYFISDTHFGHGNIMKFEAENRGHYASTEEMNEDMISKWNDTITHDDIVYFLGDFSMKLKRDEMIEILDRLNFKKMHAIYGNHDHTPFRQATEQCRRAKDITLTYGERIIAEGLTFYLSHYPMVLGERPKLFSVHGHLHSLESPSPTYQINVGYDYTGQIALSLEELIEIAKEKDTLKRGRLHL